MPATKKTPLARTIRWEARTPWLEIESVARFWLKAGYTESRDVRGEVGKRLLALGPSGKVTFLDTPPREPAGHLMVVGYRYGVVINYFTNAGYALSYTVRMCATFRNRLVGLHKVRWAKVKAA